MKEEEIQVALEELVGYLVDCIETDWSRFSVSIGFVAEDVLKVSGEYTDSEGQLARMTFDQDVIEMIENLKRAVEETDQLPLQGVELLLGAEGELSVEFTYETKV